MVCIDKSIILGNNKHLTLSYKVMITIKHFTASWCQPCKHLTPVMDELRRENPSVGYQKIDIDSNPDVAQRYGVRAVPTIIFEKNGTVVQQVVGVNQKSYYQSIIKSI